MLFSEVVENIPEEAKPWIREVLGADGEDVPALLGLQEGHGLDLDQWPEFQWELEEGLWLYSEEGLDMFHLKHFIAAYLGKFEPERIVSFSFSYTCSRPRKNEFGGSWLVMSVNNWLEGDTWYEIERAVKRLEMQGKKAPG